MEITNERIAKICAKVHSTCNETSELMKTVAMGALIGADMEAYPDWNEMLEFVVGELKEAVEALESLKRRTTQTKEES